jgi:uncharacterized cupredoxin-like copper-binding protein
MKARLLAFVVLAALVALSYATVASPKATVQSSTTVTVTMKEFKFALSKRKVPHGLVVFKLVNKGALPHDFKIQGKKSALIKPGKKGTLKVKLTKGTKPYLCTVPGHAKAGMKGKLKVT